MNQEKKCFKPVSNKVSFPEVEKEILECWEQEKTFEQSLKQREDAPHFTFYDGPPFATGLPHYGHLLAGTIKDIVPRYQAMRGHYVERRFGWDCHGLPIEALAQEALGLDGAAAIVEKGVDVFNEQCRSMVLQYVAEWRKTVTRMGRWVDFDNDYKTMDTTFMETIWWVFKQIWEQDRIYKAHRIMPYSWKLTTPLSNFEANRNYQQVQDPAITVKMRILDGELQDAFVLIWTTTPWTLPSNLAVCLGGEIDYVLIQDHEDQSRYLLAEARLGSYFKKEETYTLLNRFRGSEIAGFSYEPIFDYFSTQPGAFVALEDDFVTTEEGTGIVHLAPAYGEDDYRICRNANIDLVDPLDMECRFTEAVPAYAGQFCKDADKEIIRALKEAGKLVHQNTIDHSYPFCERTDTPLIYRAIDAWYVRIEDIRDACVENNNQVHWMPEYVGSKRFGNWLKDAKDWNISRNRFWGSCIPVWVSEDGEDMICVGSIAELETLSGVRVDDLHKHIVDKVTFVKDGKTFRRTPEVLDCWFESGAMPYAQNHYPFENKEQVEAHFPADFIAEGLDQTRGWFYTLMVLSTLLFKKPAFKNVVVNGLVLAEDGRKMSKRLKNYPDPQYMIDACGADALRLYLIDSPVVRAEDLRFSEQGVRQLTRDILLPLWNAYSFFVTYANVDGWHPGLVKQEASPNLMDRWILSAQERLTKQVTMAMDRYDLQAAVRPFTDFIDDLTNWYIRRSRRRFWKSENDTDKGYAYQTLHEVLLRLSCIAAPFVPFISDAIYRNLRTKDKPSSVHLCDFPEADESRRDLELEEQTQLVMHVVEMGRSLRAEYELKIRQPLQGIHIAARNQTVVSNIEELKHVIQEELNVKEVAFLASESGLAHLKAKPNFRALGPRFGKQIKPLGKAIAALDDAALERYLGGEHLHVELEGQVVELAAGDLIIERVPREGLAVASVGEVVVALETELTPDLLQEGLAREFVSKVQHMRKELDLEVTQRIDIEYQTNETVQKAVDRFQDYIMAETLAKQCIAITTSFKGTDWELNGHACTIAIH